MPLGVLQHYTIEPSDLERAKNFYCDVLGLENGDRPPLGFPGYWLYSGGIPTVHLLGPRTPREGITVRGTDEQASRCHCRSRQDCAGSAHSVDCRYRRH